MVSAFAGLEKGVIDINSKITGLGLFTKISPPAQCWIYANGGTHGSINVTRAIEVSCNYFFYEVGYRLSFDEDGDYQSSLGLAKLNEMAGNFGLDEHTGLELPDLSSVLSSVDPSRTAIGQAENNYTPVQMARYVATVANGGTLYELSIVDKIMAPTGELIEDTSPAVTQVNDFEEAHVEAVKAGMLAVTEGSSGSARSYFYNFPIQVGGKTGTAQESLVRPPHSYFVSFAPYDEPEIAVIAVVPFGYGSSKAIPIARDVIAAYYEFYEDHTEYTNGFMLNE
jgi:penicillin-binding protein 2